MPRILVIDDNPDIQNLVVILLGRAGYDAICVTSPAEALALAEQARPSAVLVDIARAYDDPAEPLALLQASRWLRQTPLIAISGRPDLDRATAQALGYSDFIAKPFHIHSLIDQIEAALQRGPRAPRWLRW